jgi:hypothetical protein
MVLQLKRRLALALAGTAVLAACSGAGSSPKVPKEAIEKAASTKIPDAADAGADAEP